MEGCDQTSPSPIATYNFAAANPCQEQPPPSLAAPTGRKVQSTVPHGAPPSFDVQGEGAVGWVVFLGLCPRWPGCSLFLWMLYPIPIASEGCCRTAVIKATWGFLL